MTTEITYFITYNSKVKEICYHKSMTIFGYKPGNLHMETIHECPMSRETFFKDLKAAKGFFEEYTTKKNKFDDCSSTMWKFQAR